MEQARIEHAPTGSLLMYITSAGEWFHVTISPECIWIYAANVISRWQNKNSRQKEYKQDKGL